VSLLDRLVLSIYTVLMQKGGGFLLFLAVQLLKFLVQ
jgi:hypothetical protein